MNRSTKPRVLLIAPTAVDFEGRPIKERRLHLPALTLPLLAALTPPDVELRLVYETVDDIPYDEPWDLVGLTGMGSGLVRAWQIADEFRSRKVKVVIGGIAATSGKPEWTLAHAEVLVQGEAEELWSQVIEDYKADSLKSIYTMKRRPSLENLPIPRYDLMNRRTLGLWRPVQATRGCPHTCKFCSVTSFFEGSYRRRPVEDVVRDVRAAKKAGSRYIAFIDDHITGDVTYCMELFEKLIDENIIWMSQSTLQIAKRPELMKLAYRSGCRLLSIGIESTNTKSLESIRKKFNHPHEYDESIFALRQNGIEVSTEMIVGMDTDDISIIEETYKFIMNNRIKVPRVHILTPVPGTPLYDELEEQGRILSHNFDEYTGGKAVFSPRNIDPTLLQKEYWRLYERLYSWPAIVKRLRPSGIKLSPYMWGVVLAANLKYRWHIRNRISPGIL